MSQQEDNDADSDLSEKEEVKEVLDEELSHKEENEDQPEDDEDKSNELKDQSDKDESDNEKEDMEVEKEGVDEEEDEKERVDEDEEEKEEKEKADEKIKPIEEKEGKKKSLKEKKVSVPPRSLSDEEYQEIFDAVLARMEAEMQAEEQEAAKRLDLFGGEIKEDDFDAILEESDKDIGKYVEAFLGEDEEKMEEEEQISSTPVLEQIVHSSQEEVKATKKKPTFKKNPSSETHKKDSADKITPKHRELLKRIANDVGKNHPKTKVKKCPSLEQQMEEKTERKISLKQQMLQRKVLAKGTWVQCETCDKWRYLADVYDPALLPQKWICAYNTNPERNNCAADEDTWDEDEHTDEYVFTKYTEGSIVWARMSGFPWWPAMVEDDPDNEDFFECNVDMKRSHGQTNVATHYHVVFFDDKVSRAWVNSSNVHVFTGMEDMGTCKSRGVNHKKQIAQAMEKAMTALEYSLEERIREFGFAARFKGKWGSNQDGTSEKKIKKKRKKRSLSRGDADSTMLLEAEELLKNTESVLDELLSMSESEETDVPLPVKKCKVQPGKKTKEKGTPVKKTPSFGKTKASPKKPVAPKFGKRKDDNDNDEEEDKEEKLNTPAKKKKESDNMKDEEDGTDSTSKIKDSHDKKQDSLPKKKKKCDDGDNDETAKPPPNKKQKVSGSRKRVIGTITQIKSDEPKEEKTESTSDSKETEGSPKKVVPSIPKPKKTVKPKQDKTKNASDAKENEGSPKKLVPSIPKPVKTVKPKQDKPEKTKKEPATKKADSAKPNATPKKNEKATAAKTEKAEPEKKVLKPVFGGPKPKKVAVVKKQEDEKARKEGKPEEEKVTDNTSQANSNEKMSDTSVPTEENSETKEPTDETKTEKKEETKKPVKPSIPKPVKPKKAFMAPVVKKADPVVEKPSTKENNSAKKGADKQNSVKGNNKAQKEKVTEKTHGDSNLNSGKKDTVEKTDDPKDKKEKMVDKTMTNDDDDYEINADDVEKSAEKGKDEVINKKEDKNNVSDDDFDFEMDADDQKQIIEPKENIFCDNDEEKVVSAKKEIEKSDDKDFDVEFDVSKKMQGAGITTPAAQTADDSDFDFEE